MEIKPVFVPISEEKEILDNPVSFFPIDKNNNSLAPQLPAESATANDYDIITMGARNPSIRANDSVMDLPFYQTKETLADPETYRNFIKNIESRFRRSPEYTAYKAYLMGLGMDHCQIMGNIESEKGVDIELHHNILNLFDDCILICEHILNTVGYVSSFDIIQLLINEHFANRIPCCFLSTTAHQMYTDDKESYIPPDMTWGKWWELLAKYRYGITYDIANKVNNYIYKYQNNMPTTVQILPQEQILNFAYYNEYGIPVNEYTNQPLINMNSDTQVANYFNTSW